MFIISAAVNGSSNSPSPTAPNTSESQTPAPQTVAPQPTSAAPRANSTQQKDAKTSASDTQRPPRDSNGLIHQLKITASAQSRSIAFTSQENYTNCTNNLTVITVDANQQPTFTTYTDNHSTGLNLFAGDQHSTAYGSLTDSNGDTLAADINSGMYGNNAAGTWGITCDQGQYGLTIKSL